MLRFPGRSCGLLAIAAAAAAPGIEANSDPVSVVLKDTVVVNESRVRLGDVAAVEGLAPDQGRRLQDLELGKAPLPGYSIWVTRRDVASFLEARIPGLYSRIAWKGPPAARVEAGGSRYPASIFLTEAERALRDWLTARFSAYEIHPIGPNRDLVLPVGSIEVRPFLPKTTTLGRRMCVWVELRVDGEVQRNIPVWFSVSVPGRVLTLSRGVPRGHPLGPSDVEAVERDLATVRGTPVADPAELSGLRARRQAGAGTALVREDLEPLPPVSKGDRINVHASSGPVHLLVPAIADTDGFLNQRIRVRRDAAGESYWVRVVGPGEATTDRESAATPPSFGEVPLGEAASAPTSAALSRPRPGEGSTDDLAPAGDEFDE
jgi:flagella basal body P-ring formation protein FlgA